MSAHSVLFHRIILPASVGPTMAPRSLSCTALATLLIVLHATLCFAGAIWTDANDDGLPDSPGTLVVAAGDVVSVDLWIDSQSFAWSNFLVYAEWTPGCFAYVSGQYIISDGTNFPIDSFSHPAGVGFGGFTYSHQGVDAIATVNVRALTAGVCCVTPIIDPNNSYSVFSQLGTNSDYFLFTSNPNSCWTVSSTPQACCLANGSCALLTPEACVAASGTPRGQGTTCANVVCAQPTARGACCMTSGSCTSPVTAAECAAAGGVYQGDGTDCASVNCVGPVGACCYPSGACVSPIGAAECASGGGTYRGNGTTCATVSCPSPQGACCFSNETCQLLTAAACAAAGGAYQGSGTTCATVSCAPPPPQGACCLPGGACTGPMTAAQCASNGGTYQGDGTTCATAACPQPPVGACCLPSGFCTGPMTAAQCAANGGAYQGNATTCATTSCPVPPPTGACCYPSGTCIGAITESVCTSLGGTYQGNGTTCATVNCSPPQGACCYANGTCAVQTEAACVANGGEYRGNSISCATANCLQTGACCVPNFGCAPNNTAAQCAALGGIYLGDGSVCGPSACTGTRIWTDANSDGLPDIGAPFVGVQGDVVSMDLWIDSQDFQWTNYLAYIEWPAACMSLDGASYLISGGSNFPIDDFSHPSGVGFGGSGYDEIGIDRIGRVRVRLDAPMACCVTPIIDSNNPFYVFSQLGRSSAYRLFDNQSGSCWTTSPPPPIGACCFNAPASCQARTQAQCAAAGGVYLGDGTSCATDTCPEPPPATGACCVARECIGELTQLDCESVGGMYRGDNTRCTTPNVCVPAPPCPPPTPGVTGAILKKESSGAGVMRGKAATPCALPASTNGNAANYRWYNVCSGYIWIYSALEAGEGVGVRFGGPSQPAVNGDNDVKRVITYFRNVCPNYNQTVDVFVDVDFEGDGCPNVNLGSDLNVDPGLRWNCSDFSVSMPCGVNDIIVRTVHDGGTSPSFATDGPFTATCDPNAPGRSYYYGINGSACIPWRGADGTFDNFLCWLILDTSAPCLNAVEPTTWGRIKGMYR